MKTIPGKNLYVVRIEEDSSKYYVLAEDFEDALKLWQDFAQSETMKDIRIVEPLTTVIYG